MNYSKLKQLAISENGFIFHPSTGATFTTNHTGLFLVNELKKDQDECSAVKAMVEKFSADEIEAQKDFEGFVKQLEMYGLL